MTLLERINQLRLKAVAADNEHKIRSRSGEFVALRERMQNASAIAPRVAAGRRELEAAGLTEDGYDQDRATTCAGIKALIATIESLSVESKFDLVKMQGQNVEMHFRNSEKFVANAWRSHLPPYLPTGDDLLDALDQAGVDVEAIRSDIESARLVLLTLRNRALPQPGDALRLQQALSTIDASKARIGHVIDPVIADLVVRAQTGEVPFAEMTPEVVSALADIGILSRFRVVLR
jgi:hypothetical protein